MPSRRTAHSGFTLIELMIAVAIIGILLAIAIPSYRNYVQSAARSTVKADLSEIVSLMERRFTEQGFYGITRGVSSAANCPSLTTLPFFNASPKDSNTKHYTVAFQGSCADDTYTIRATPIAGGLMSSDGYFEANSQGQRRWVNGSVTKSW
ncbi:type IV pilin protein [Chitinimonas lacunae]|uniref:Type IV pilin protein n=1 Tax=Chitinimonas lacunae TaxID=1963018 RepID=A0ABV8MS65_9NEIS